jgi:uncharacterized OB-fold protein
MSVSAPSLDGSPHFTPFADGLAQGRLLLQRCDTCGTVQLGHIRCDACLGRSLAWVPSTGRGRIHAYVVMHRVYHPAFAERIPYAAGFVELDDGPRIPSAFAIERAHLHAGLRVHIAWDRLGPETPICFVEERG